MYKRKLLPLLGLLLSGAAVAPEYTTYSELDKPVTETAQDNETVVEFFLFYCPPYSKQAFTINFNFVRIFFNKNELCQ